MPVSGKFTQRQLEIYTIVEACHDYALELSKPGVKYYDVHMGVCRLMTERLKELGLMKGDTDEALAAYARGGGQGPGGLASTPRVPPRPC